MHRVVGADAEAVVAGEAVAAGQAATGLEQGRALVEALDDLLERALAADVLEERSDRPRSIGVVPGVELLERRQLRPPAGPPATPRSQLSMHGRPGCPCPIATATIRSAGDHVAAGEDARVTGHHPLVDLDDAILDADPLEALEQGQVGALAEGQHQAVRVELLELAGRLRECRRRRAPSARAARVLAGRGDRREPAEGDPLLLGLLHLLRVGRHPLAGAAIDDHRLGAGPAPRVRAASSAVFATAVDDDAAGRAGAARPSSIAVQHRDGVENVRGRPAGEIDVAGDVRADRQEGGVVFALAHRLGERLDTARCSRARLRARGSGRSRRRASSRGRR